MGNRAKALEVRDKCTEGHSKRVAELAVELAKEMGIEENSLVHIYRGAFLHDIGKIGNPDRILSKNGSLTEEEWTLMQTHPSIARDLLERLLCEYSRIG